MTIDQSDVANKTQTTFQRANHGTQVREAYWLYTGMRSLSASYADGTHRIALITHKDSERRHTSFSAHNVVGVSVGSDDSLALDLRVVSEDGTALTINLFGIELGDLLEAVAQAVAEKHPITEDSEA